MNLSENGACFLIKKELVPDIADWVKGTQLTFEFRSDTDRDADDGIVPVYTCTVMHVGEDGDNYKVGVNVSEDVGLS